MECLENVLRSSPWCFWYNWNHQRDREWLGYKTPPHAPAKKRDMAYLLDRPGLQLPSKAIDRVTDWMKGKVMVKKGEMSETSEKLGFDAVGCFTIRKLIVETFLVVEQSWWKKTRLHSQRRWARTGSWRWTLGEPKGTRGSLWIHMESYELIRIYMV